MYSILCILAILTPSILTSPLDQAATKKCFDTPLSSKGQICVANEAYSIAVFKQDNTIYCLYADNFAMVKGLTPLAAKDCNTVDTTDKVAMGFSLDTGALISYDQGISGDLTVADDHIGFIENPQFPCYVDQDVLNCFSSSKQELQKASLDTIFIKGTTDPTKVVRIHVLQSQDSNISE